MVEQIDAENAPKVDAPHRIVVAFPDDHSINGMRVEVLGITPEQMSIALFHLTRSMNQLADARQLQEMMGRQEIDEMARVLRNGGKPSNPLAAIRGGRT